MAKQRKVRGSACTEENGKRISKETVNSGAFMVDFYHMTGEQLRQLFEIAIPGEDQQDNSPVLLLHITPSGKELSVVAEATKSGIFADCQPQSDCQHALAKSFNATQLLDKDRLSFCTQVSDVLYLSERPYIFA